MVITNFIIEYFGMHKKYVGHFGMMEMSMDRIDLNL